MNGSGTAAGITYDGFGNRVSKTVNSVTTQYLIEDDVNPTRLPQVFDELTTSSTMVRLFCVPRPGAICSCCRGNGDTTIVAG
jgi:YD repeat-containing protein